MDKLPPSLILLTWDRVVDAATDDARLADLVEAVASELKIETTEVVDAVFELDKDAA